MIAALFALALVSFAATESREHREVAKSRVEFEDACFSVRWGRWREGARTPPLKMRGAPQSVWLTDQRLAADLQGGVLFVMRAAPGDREPGFAAAHWRHVAENGELILEWSTPFQGIRARFPTDSPTVAGGRRLVGSSVTWSHRPEDGSQRASVELIPRRCF